MITIPQIDVRKLLTELNRIKGLSDAKIGKAIGVPDATISRLRIGRHKTTSGERTIAIANYHAQVFGRE